MRGESKTAMKEIGKRYIGLLLMCILIIVCFYIFNWPSYVLVVVAVGVITNIFITEMKHHS